MASKLAVSLIIPAYNSHSTIRRSLETFTAQDYPNLEIIVVDSSPNRLSEEIVNEHFEGVHYIHSTARMLPHAARNYGVEHSKGEILIFSDPDIYAPVDWVSKMVSQWEIYKQVIIGGLKCYNHEYYKRGVHLVKFDLWLPGGSNVPIKITPTANMLIDRVTFDEVGPFDSDEMLGDTLYSWRLEAHNKPVLFVPGNSVDHDHVCSVRDHLRERYFRGEDFGRLRSKAEKMSASKKIFTVAISVLPVRLLKLQLRILKNCIRASNVYDFIVGQPLIILGWYMWLLGECKAYLSKQ